MPLLYFTTLAGLVLSPLLLSCSSETTQNGQVMSNDDQAAFVSHASAGKTANSPTTLSDGPARNVALKTAIETVIAADMQALEIDMEEQKLFTDYIDLNGDGTQDAIVIMIGSYWCGTGGCTMFVFEGQDQKFRLVSQSSLIRPPLNVSDTKTQGWNDLIVTVSGGGMPSKTVALKFDGKQYPLNPSDQPSLPANSSIKGKALFPEGSEPRTMAEFAPGPSASQSAQPAFDCTKADGEVETLICQDAKLAALDRQLDGVYQTALKKAEQFPPKDLADFKAAQIGWIKGRNDCWKTENVKGCVQTNYTDRTAELQASFALAPSQAPVFYACNNNPANEIVATYYETEPPTARLERGDTTITAFLRPAASGSKYEGQNVTFWIKGNEAMVEWNSEKLQCKVN